MPPTSSPSTQTRRSASCPSRGRPSSPARPSPTSSTTSGTTARPRVGGRRRLRARCPPRDVQQRRPRRGPRTAPRPAPHPRVHRPHGRPLRPHRVQHLPGRLPCRLRPAGAGAHAAGRRARATAWRTSAWCGSWRRTAPSSTWAPTPPTTDGPSRSSCFAPPTSAPSPTAPLERPRSAEQGPCPVPTAGRRALRRPVPGRPGEQRRHHLGGPAALGASRADPDPGPAVGDRAARELRTADRDRARLARAHPRRRSDAHLQHRSPAPGPGGPDPRDRTARPSPLLSPADDERSGYVPNVVYSCGAMRHGRTIVLPYGCSDAMTRIATVDLDRLLDAMRPPRPRRRSRTP